MSHVVSVVAGNRRGRRARPTIEAMEGRTLFSFVVDPSTTTISASAGAGGSFQQVSTNPAHAQDASTFAGNSFQSAYSKSASANASYQAAALQLTFHADATVSDNSSYPTSDAQGTITLNFSLTAAATVQFNATLSGTGGGGSNFDLDSFASGAYPIQASSSTATSVHKALSLSAGNYAIDFAAACNSGTVAGAAALDLTVTIGTTTPPHITSANAVMFQIGKPSSFTITTTGDPTPSIKETAVLPDGITFVDNGNGTATLSGTPKALDAAGHYDLIITASNGVPIDSTHPNATQFLTLTLTNSGVQGTLPATHLIFGTQPPASTTAGTTFPLVTVLVEDKLGHIVTTDTSAVSLKLTGTAGGVLNGVATVNAVDGVAIFSGLMLTKAGTYTLGAADGGLRPARSRPFKITPDTNSAHLVMSQTSIGTAPSAKPLKPLSALLEDQYGNIIKTNHTAVTLLVASGPAGAVLKGKVTAPFINGVATLRNIHLTPAGTYTLNLVDSALPGNGSLPVSLTAILT